MSVRKIVKLKLDQLNLNLFLLEIMEIIIIMLQILNRQQKIIVKNMIKQIEQYMKSI